MIRGYLDTSAVLKLYMNEFNSAQVKQVIATLDQLIISRLTQIEVGTAIYGLVRRKRITYSHATKMISAFEADQFNYQNIIVSDECFVEAKRLVATFGISQGLRTADALQLASAIVEHKITPIDFFLTTDQVLAEVATLEGFDVKP